MNICPPAPSNLSMTSRSLLMRAVFAASLLCLSIPAFATPSKPGRVRHAEQARAWAQRQQAPPPAQQGAADRAPQGTAPIDGMLWVDETPPTPAPPTPAPPPVPRATPAPVPAPVPAAQEAPAPQPSPTTIEDVSGDVHHLPPTR